MNTVVLRKIKREKKKGESKAGKTDWPVAEGSEKS